jgi:hypothetical protein
MSARGILDLVIEYGRSESTEDRFALFDAIKAGVEKMEREHAEMHSALAAAVPIIKGWHNFGVQDGSELDVWQIYYDNAPEMKPIREALEAK